MIGFLDRNDLSQMNSVSSHRGPDDQGQYLDRKIPATLGHNRLTIIDLTERGHQPMSDSSGRFWITYNGEIYNYEPLRRDLIDKGYKFSSQTDTEVILYSFREWGSKCLERFRGMFAFAILDRGPEFGPDPKRTNRLPEEPYIFMARDRFGIKPLVYSNLDKGFIFASEIKSLLASGEIEPKINSNALADYLWTGSVYQPKSMLEGVEFLDAGSAMTVSRDGSVRKKFKYWDLYEETEELRERNENRTYEELVTQTRDKLENATEAHLVSDVPVGAFLSGGLDSSAVVALMAEQKEDPIKTFTVGFSDEADVLDERPFAREAANFIGADLKEVIIHENDISDYFEDIIKSLDQPSIDGTNSYLVSKAAAQEVKVALSGLGGDELFAGYRHFERYNRANREGQGIVDKLLFYSTKFDVNRFNKLAHLKGLEDVNRPFEIRKILSDKIFRRLINGSKAERLSQSIPREHLKNVYREDLDPILKLSYLECRGYLQNTLLRDIDVMSMTHSLEVRPVLLDHELAEFVFSLPGSAKLKDGRLKRVFVDAVKDLLPERIYQRDKAGFELPFSSWMSGPLKERVEWMIHTKQASELFQPSYIKSIGHQLENEKLPKQVWAWLILISWMESYDVTWDL